MKLKQLNNNGSRLKVYINGDMYAMDLYQDFDSVQELTEYMQDNFGVSRHQYSYFY